MIFKTPFSRRNFLTLAGVAGAGIAASACTGPIKPQDENGTVIEFLERQHGMLRRTIFILEEIRGGMDARMDLSPEILQGTVDIVSRLMVDYHQRIEEKYIYPAFDTAKKMGGLVGILREQHAAGSQLTGILKQLAAGFSAKDHEKRRTLGGAIHQFSRMYRAHADREDTVLLPVLRQVITPVAYREMSKVFENEEKQAFGQNGLEELTRKLVGYEEALGIGDLAAFTPRVEDLR
ncbi:MAG: hemerythrin domain-containing protein [Syntrophobacter sp.]